jgi:O-antigen/teichoic acid export membrane protein
VRGVAAGSARRAWRDLFDTTLAGVARNSSWALGATVVTAVGLFAETIVLARYLGLDAYGVYLLVVAVPEAILLVLGFRTREAMTRYLGGFLARGERGQAAAVVKLLWLVDLAVVALACVVVYATAPLIGPWLTGDEESVTLIRVYALALFATGLVATAGAILRVYDRFRLAFLVGCGGTTLRLGLLLVAVAAAAGLEGVVWARVGSEAGAALLAGGAAVLLLRRSLWTERRTPLRALSGRYREITGFLVHTNVQGSVRAAASKLDVVAVGALAGPGTAALYKVAVQFGSAPALCADPLFAAVYPLFARLHALGDERRIRAVGRKLTLLLAVVALPAGTVLALGAGALLGLVAGPEFAAAGTALAVVLAGVVPAVVLFWGRPAMLALGDAAAFTRITLVASVAQFALLLALVVPLGATGAALGLAAAHLVTVALVAHHLRRRGLL